jgi:hypothetical protein
LTAAHWLQRNGVPQHCERGTEVDTAELPGSFRPSPWMVALDEPAWAMLCEVADSIRRSNGRNLNIAAWGHASGLPGSEGYKEPKPW